MSKSHRPLIFFAVSLCLFAEGTASGQTLRTLLGLNAAKSHLKLGFEDGRSSMVHITAQGRVTDSRFGWPIEKSFQSDIFGDLRHHQVGEVNYGYFRFGSGPPLMLICGITMTMTQWDLRLLKELEKSFDVVVFDNPGIGETADKSTSPLTIEGMAAGTLALAEGLGIERPHILGWSMGGEIATAIGALHSDKVGSVVVAAGNPGGPQVVPTEGTAFQILMHSKATGKARKRQLASILFPENQRRAALRYGVGLMFAPRDEATKAAVSRQLKAVEQWKSGPGIWEQLGQSQSRMLFAGGNQDVIVPIQNSVKMAEQAPQGQLKRYSDAGHAFLFQDPRGFAVEVRDFLLKD